MRRVVASFLAGSALVTAVALPGAAVGTPSPFLLVSPAPPADAAAALATAEKAIAKDGKDVAARRAAAEACLALGRIDDAEKHALAGLEASGDKDAACWLLAARACSARADALPAGSGQDQYVDARRKAAAALKADPAIAGAKALLGRSMRMLEQVDEAEKVLREAAAANPADGEVHFELGELLLIKRKQHAEAAASYDRAVALDAGRPLWFARLGLARAYLKEWDAAYEAWVKAAVLEPRDNTALRQIQKFGAKRTEELLRRVIKEQPESAWAHAYLAWTLGATKRGDEARKEMKAAAAIDPKNGLVRAYEVETWKVLGNADEARRSAREALQLDPAADLAWNHLFAEAFAPTSTQTPAGRIEIAEFMLKIRPDDAGAWNNLGLFHRDTTRDYRKSLAAYLKASELAPLDQGIQNDTGLIYHFHGASIGEDPKAAIEYYERTLALVDESADDPKMGYWDALENLCVYYSAKGMPNSVEENAEAALHYAERRMDPKFPPSGRAPAVARWAREKLGKK